MQEKLFTRALVVDDHARLRRTIVDFLVPRVEEVRQCGSVKEALELTAVWRPDLLLLDFKLPDGDARDVLAQVASVPPVPTTIAMSAFASPAQSFELAKLGVRAYLTKPFAESTLDEALNAARQAPDLTPHVRNLVGKTGLQDVEERVRATMVVEAMTRSGGSRRGAARLLQVSRQFVQHALKKLRDG